MLWFKAYFTLAVAQGFLKVSKLFAFVSIKFCDAGMSVADLAEVAQRQAIEEEIRRH